jgi:hypothetical protein
MIDLRPAPVPTLSDEWIDRHRKALVDALEPSRHRSMKWVTLTGATGVAATVSAIVLFGGSQQYAFAGWSASPTTPATGQVSTAEADCQAQLAHPRFVPTNRGTDASSLRSELSDVRGPYTFTLFGNGDNEEVLCVSALGNMSLRWITQSNTPVAAGKIVVDQVAFREQEGQPYTMVVGRTGADVTGVTLSLANGDSVTATSGNGYFLAWWPGSDVVPSATVDTATGTSTQSLDLTGSGDPPPTKSSAGSPGTQSSCVETVPALAAQRDCVAGSLPPNKPAP